MFEVYNQQVKLLLSCLPIVSRAKKFALKGGTAINMFVRDQYPRLSVDIDLTYLPVHGRNESILTIEKCLLDISNSLKMELKYKVEHCSNPATKTITKIRVDNNVAKIIIEPNLILRGTLYPIVQLNLSQKVQDLYQISASDMQVLSVEELYAGKICAALDRQHPRDLFDVKFILEEGITERTKIAFLIYLISNNRPMFELLSPNRIDQRKAYEDEFVGMTNIDISYEALVDIREQLIIAIKNLLNEQDKLFLMSVKSGAPRWDHIQIPGVTDLPSIKWKLMNISKMDKKKAKDYLIKLESLLYS